MLCVGVSWWSLSDSKSPQVSWTRLRILAVLSNAVVWIVSTRPSTIKSSRPFNNPFVIAPKYQWRTNRSVSKTFQTATPPPYVSGHTFFVVMSCFIFAVNISLWSYLSMLYFDLRPGQKCHSQCCTGRSHFRVMHLKRVTSELHYSYFCLMTIKHAIPKIEWAIEWALNYHIT